jgi:hypothetical protein
MSKNFLAVLGSGGAAVANDGSPICSNVLPIFGPPQLRRESMVRWFSPNDRGKGGQGEPRRHGRGFLPFVVRRYRFDHCVRRGQGSPDNVGVRNPLFRVDPNLRSHAMFERGDPFPWLDQRKHPWISLTNAAVFLSQRDSSGRSKAVYCHEWALPFSLLLEWIDTDLITVYEASAQAPFKRILKEELLCVPIKFPSYTLADRLETISRFEPGSETYIECNHNLSRFTPAKDRYYVRNEYEPRWHDLKVQSEELIAAIKTACTGSPEWVAAGSEEQYSMSLRPEKLRRTREGRARISAG